MICITLFVILSLVEETHQTQDADDIIPFEEYGLSASDFSPKESRCLTRCINNPRHINKPNREANCVNKCKNVTANSGSAGTNNAKKCRKCRRNNSTQICKDNASCA